MRFRGAALCLFVSVLAGSTVVTPSRAAALVQWQDPAGDATALPGMETSPRPSDQELDLLKVSFANRGHNLTASARVERMGTALGSEGSAFRFYFSYNKQRYYFEAQMATLPYFLVFGVDPGFYRERRGAESDEKLACACSNSFDFRGHSVTFTVNRSAVARALGVAAGGASVTGLEVRALRTMYERVEADIARAPGGATLRV